jgi:predicted ATPase
MNQKRIVITGGPGSGKTTLIEHLEIGGHAVMHEVSRAVIKAAQEEGIEQLFLEDPMLFSQKLLESRLNQFEEASSMKDSIIFYDRGMPDVTAYMDYIGSTYTESFDQPCVEFRYDSIFLLPPWEGIYLQDNERYESFDQAVLIYKFLLRGYQKYGYNIIEVPVGTIDERIHFIFGHLNQGL